MCPGGFCEKLDDYSKTNMIKEVQNKKEYLSSDGSEVPDESNTGINMSRNYITRLKDLAQDLI